jgi:outer membrane lipoprotein-sorting protein
MRSSRHRGPSAGGLALFAIGTLAASVARGGEGPPRVDVIVRKAEHTAYYQGDDGRANVKMTITDADGRTREREFVILRRDVEDGAEQKFYVYFESPPEWRRAVYLVWKHLKTDDDRWLYSPGLDHVSRIEASDKRNSFVGSHFVYEDVSGRSIQEDTHELIETTDEFFVVKNVPKDPKSVEFASYTVWIDRQTALPRKAEYLHKDDGKKYRVVEALEVKQIQGYWTVTKSRVQDLRNGGNTVSEFSDIRYDLGLPDSVFTERYLRRPPRRYLK